MATFVARTYELALDQGKLVEGTLSASRSATMADITTLLMAGVRTATVPCLASW
jgi:hypothetical protein